CNPSGVFHLFHPHSDTYTDVYCDQKTKWKMDCEVIMRRLDVSVNFNREWEDYKRGIFGRLPDIHYSTISLHVTTIIFHRPFKTLNIPSCYFCSKGNEFMHKITTEEQPYLLRVELRSYEGEFIYAEYRNVWIGPESDNYRLHVTGNLHNSTAGDSLHHHNGMVFSTVSRDNDEAVDNCAPKHGAACSDTVLVSS
ncbi:hypothetical protein LSH36_839g04032, partial [Paralvinella palmiformis]